MTLLYRIATGVIFLGFIMLCQPVSLVLFTWGFPILLVGTALFLVLDHIPEEKARKLEHKTNR